jgi:hypothetical protein
MRSREDDDIRDAVRVPRNFHEEDLHAAPTLANYEAYLRNEFLNDADKFFRMYPAATDADVRDAFIAFDTDYGFGFPAHRFAANMANAGQKAWFCSLIRAKESTRTSAHSTA